MPYEIISKIASGTFGTVYKVQESTNGELYALKLIHENYKTPKELKRIKRGFETAQKVSHPNCVKMIEWYENGKDVGFVMEFVETIDVLTQSEAINGNSKSESLTNSQNLTETISKIIQIANGLEALHSAGIVHRDLKPANILETKQGKIKITDFDLVKLDDSSTLTASGAFLGTAKYSSPEQCQNAAKIDHRSDLYSLGILFYQMVCGRVPFEGNSLAEIALAHIRTPLISPKQFVPDLPEVLNSVISKLLKKNPKERFQSAQEVSMILDTFLKEGKVENLETFGDFLLTPSFVGRRKEFSELNKIFSETNGKLKTVFLSGEQGVGKTKLWKEFRLGLPQDSTLAFETKCRKNGNTFEPLQTILNKALEQIENLSAKEQAEKIGRFGRDLTKILPQIEQKLLFKHLPEIPTHEGFESELRLFEALTTFLENIQNPNQTLVFFFDDLHWVDEQSLNFLGYLTRSLTENSILVVGTVRSEEITQLEREIEEPEILTLKNFTLEEVRELLTKMFGKADPVNTKFCEEILKRTGGNALFVQELMFHLLETKILNKSEGEWNLGKESFSKLKMPKSIQSVVEERLDFLPKKLLRLIEVGSLLGKYFTSKIVAEVLSKEENEVESKLTSQAFEGILEKSESDIFEFVNDSFRESLESSIKPTIKKSLHKKIADYLEKNFEEADVLEELAIHFFEANVKKKALKYCIEIGELLKGIYDFSKSESFLFKAINLFEEKEISKKISLMNLRAECFQHLGDFEESEKIQLNAIELANKFGVEKARVADAYLSLGKVKSDSFDFENAHNFFKKALEILMELKDYEFIVQAYREISRLFIYQNNYSEAQKYSDLALKVANEHKIYSEINRCYTYQCTILGSLGKFEEALVVAKKIYELAKKNESSSKEEKSIGLIFLGWIYKNLRNFKKALFYFEKAVQNLGDNSYSGSYLRALDGVSSCNFELGNYEKAIECSFKIIKPANQIKDLRQVGKTYNDIASFYIANGKFDEANQMLEKSLKASGKLNEENQIANSGLLLGEIEFAKGNFLKAISNYEEAIKTYSKIGMDFKIPSLKFKIAHSNYKMESFHKSLEIVSECRNLAEKYKDENVLFDCKILKCKNDFMLEKREQAIKNIYSLLQTESDKTRLAILRIAFCKLFAKDESLGVLISDSFDFQFYLSETKNLAEKIQKEKFDYKMSKDLEELIDLEKPTITLDLNLISSLVNWAEPTNIFRELLEFLEKKTNANSAILILKNPISQKFEISSYSKEISDESLVFSNGILNESITKNKSLIIENALENPEFNSNESVVGKIFLSVLVTPLVWENKIIGSIYVERTKLELGKFKKTDLLQAQRIASLITPILQKQIETKALKAESEVKNLGLFIGNTSAMQTLYQQIQNASKVNYTTYIYGETGTGKELVANAIHRLSKRKENPFITVNCSAIPKDLAESEFFGHTKGSFSGAISNKIGKFELADNGTLFLDEVAELTLEIQTKLLRAIQEKEIWRVGGTEGIKINVKIIVATHKNLVEEVKRGNFREDLFHRINVLKIGVPPLRKRKDDIPLLANYFLDKICKDLKKENLGFTSKAMQFLQKENWSGNIRELENIIARATINVHKQRPLTEADFLSNESLVSQEDKLQVEDELEINKLTFDERLEVLGKRILLENLESNSWNKQKTARELGISRNRLKRLISKYSLNDPN